MKEYSDVCMLTAYNICVILVVIVVVESSIKTAELSNSFAP